MWEPIWCGGWTSSTEDAPIASVGITPIVLEVGRWRWVTTEVVEEVAVMGSELSLAHLSSAILWKDLGE